MTPTGLTRLTWLSNRLVVHSGWSLLGSPVRNGSLHKDGHVFYGYLLTVGRQSLPLMEFSEEVRDLLIYTGYLPFHD